MARALMRRVGRGGRGRLDAVTGCLYSRPMKMLNIRLGPEDARRAAQLRRAGFAIAGLVRDALRAAYERHVAPRAWGRRPSEIMASIYRECPDPPELPHEKRDLSDRRRVRRIIRRRLRRS